MNLEKGIVLLDFYSDQCHPCKLLMADLEELSNEFSDITIHKVNIMDSYDLTEKYQIRSVPTLVMLKDSASTASYTGYKGKEDLKKFLKDNT